MIVEHTQYKIDEKRRALFEQANRMAAEVLASSHHCLRYELSRSAENPDYYTLRIEWDSEEAHLNGFRSSPEFKTFLSLVRPYVRDIQEMCSYEVMERTRNQAEANPFTSA